MKDLAPMASLISLARNVTSAVASSTLAQNATLGATPITQDPAVLSAIPGAWNIDPCTESTQSRCFITCRTTDTVCQSAASSFVGTCEADWESYFSIQSGQASTESGWDYTTTVAGSAGSVIPTTVESYTTFSTATESFVKQNADLELTTLTPVYALGTPVLIETITTVPDYRNTYTVLTGPEPTCKYYSVFTMDPEDCGQCTIRGGTVDLLFWPPTTATVSDAGAPPMSTVVNGSTLISPSAYIHLRTILASNSCSRVGKEYTATMLAMDPEAISTQIHIGGKVAAYEYGQLDYADLTGLPPASEYEMQPSCVMFGCETIYSTTFFPTLKVPEQVRSIDPEWADCGLGLEGL